MEEEGVHTFIDGKEIALIAKNSALVSLYCKWIDDPICRKYAPFIIPRTLDEVKKYLEPQMGVKKLIEFDIYHKGEEKVIGFIGVKEINWFHRLAEIFYLIGERDYWNRGLATKAVILMLNYTFKELNLHKIFGEVLVPNIASIRIFEKLGFSLEGTFKEECYIDGKYHDIKRYGCLKAEWLKVQA
jgi:RimJ/RimL family protein N-acetyltransferase